MHNVGKTLSSSQIAHQKFQNLSRFIVQCLPNISEWDSTLPQPRLHSQTSFADRNRPKSHTFPSSEYCLQNLHLPHQIPFLPVQTFFSPSYRLHLLQIRVVSLSPTPCLALLPTSPITIFTAFYPRPGALAPIYLNSLPPATTVSTPILIRVISHLFAIASAPFPHLPLDHHLPANTNTPLSDLAQICKILQKQCTMLAKHLVLLK